MPNIDVFSIPFQEALDYFRSKNVVPTQSWDEFDAAQHDVSYTVAGLTDAQLLQDMQGIVDEAIAEGLGIEDLKKIFKKKIENKGWSPDRLKGYDDPQKGSDWMFRVMMETPMRRAHSAGRNQQMDDPELQAILPYRYWSHAGGTEINRQPREKHRALDWNISKKVFPAKHKFWAIASPMCAFGCQCSSGLMSAAQVERRGLEVAEPPDPYEIAEPGFRGAAGMTSELDQRQAFEKSLENLSPEIKDMVKSDMKDRGGILQ